MKTWNSEIFLTRKGNQSYFRMKVHIRTDTRGLVDTITTTDAATADITQLDDILHGQETTMFGVKA